MPHAICWYFICDCLKKTVLLFEGLVITVFHGFVNLNPILMGLNGLCFGKKDSLSKVKVTVLVTGSNLWCNLNKKRQIFSQKRSCFFSKDKGMYF